MLFLFLAVLFQTNSAADVPESHCFTTIFGTFEAVNKGTFELKESYKQCLKEHPTSYGFIQSLTPPGQVKTLGFRFNDTFIFFEQKPRWFGFKEESVCNNPSLFHSYKDQLEMHNAIIALYALQDPAELRPMVSPEKQTGSRQPKAESQKLFNEMYTNKKSNLP